MTKINLKITHLKCHQNLPGANELSAVDTGICLKLNQSFQKTGAKLMMQNLFYMKQYFFLQDEITLLIDEFAKLFIKYKNRM